MLPTEDDLCRQYGVSRITVRRTMQSLGAAGLAPRRTASTPGSSEERKMTARVTIEPVSGKQLLGVARGHTVVADRPLEDGGTDTGLTAGEFLLAALGFCTMGTLLAYGSRMGLSMEGLKIQLAGEKARNPDRYGRIKVVVTVDKQVGGEIRQRLHRIARACTIHNTLVHPVEIDVEIA